MRTANTRWISLASIKTLKNFLRTCNKHGPLYQLLSNGFWDFSVKFSPNNPLTGTKVMSVSRNPACFKKYFSFPTISSNLKFMKQKRNSQIKFSTFIKLY